MGTQTDIRATDHIATDEYTDGSGGVHSPHFRHSYVQLIGEEGDALVVS